MKLNIIKHRYKYIYVSAILILISIGALLFTKLNYGIDMTGGTQAEYSFTNTIDIDKINQKLDENKYKITNNGKEIINYVGAYTITGENKLSVVTGFEYLPDSAINISEESKQSLLKELDGYKNDFRNIVYDILKEENNTITETNYTNIGKTFGDYIKNTAIVTLIIAILAIAIYVAWAFSSVVSGISVISFSTITILTLIHDVIIATGLYIIISIIYPEFKIDTYFITALLTILGYSINDTIVVFDRIRSNLSNYMGKKKSLEEIIEISITDTLRRSVFTSLTLFFILIAVFFFGPELIRGFILAMIFGTVIGTYSSIFIASPLLYDFNKKKVVGEIQEKIINIEDKIVV